jgi:hypothetical protein
LNRQASEDPRALIARLQAKAMKGMRRGPDEDEDGYGPGPVARDGSVGPSGTAGGDRGATESRPTTDSAGAGGGFREHGRHGGFLRSRYEQALGARLSGDGLSIEQSPDRFVIVRGDSRRTYTPGGHSVVSVADGVADQSSGWKGREYVIDVRPQVGPHLTERYGLTADGQLIEKVSLTEDGLPKLEFTRVYDQGAAPARVLPTSN